MTARERPYADLLRDLQTTGCIACRRAAYAEERYVFGFVYEHYSDWRTLTALRASLGFCDRHTRHLLRHHEARWVMRAVYAEVVSAALDRLRAAKPERHRAPCPICDSRRATDQSLTRAIVVALSDREVGEAYRASGGFCFPHFQWALRVTRPDEAATLILAFETRHRQTIEPHALIELLAGCDGDRLARHQERMRLAEAATHPPMGGALGALRARLEIDVCPSCFAGGAMERTYLAWVGTECRSNPSGLAAEGLWLCSRHLQDLVQEDGEAAAWVASLERSRLAGELTRLRAGLDALPAKTLGGRWSAARGELAQSGGEVVPPSVRLGRAARALVRRRDAALRDALTPFLRERGCGACRAVAVAEERETALLLAALADRPTADRYVGAHGLCLRHALTLPEAERGGLPGQVLRVRLRVLAWELEEAGRKSSWSARYEAKRDESNAWRRAAGYLDGAVSLGGPAVPPQSGSQRPHVSEGSGARKCP